MVVVAIVGLAVVAVALRRTAPALDPATPEGAVQAYLAAAADGDEVAAAELVLGKPDLYCDQTGFAAHLIGSEVSGDTATVEVRLTYTGDGPFDGGGYGSDQRFRLQRIGDGWLIEAPELAPCWAEVP